MISDERLKDMTDEQLSKRHLDAVAAHQWQDASQIRGEERRRITAVAFSGRPGVDGRDLVSPRAADDDGNGYDARNGKAPTETVAMGYNITTETVGDHDMRLRYREVFSGRVIRAKWEEHGREFWLTRTTFGHLQIGTHGAPAGGSIPLAESAETAITQAIAFVAGYAPKAEPSFEEFVETQLERQQRIYDEEVRKIREGRAKQAQRALENAQYPMTQVENVSGIGEVHSQHGAVIKVHPPKAIGRRWVDGTTRDEFGNITMAWQPDAAHMEWLKTHCPGCGCHAEVPCVDDCPRVESIKNRGVKVADHFTSKHAHFERSTPGLLTFDEVAPVDWSKLQDPKSWYGTPGLTGDAYFDAKKAEFNAARKAASKYETDDLNGYESQEAWDAACDESHRVEARGQSLEAAMSAPLDFSLQRSPPEAMLMPDSNTPRGAKK